MSEGKFRGSFGFRIFRAFGLTIVGVSILFSIVLVLLQNRALKDGLMREGRMLAVLLAGNARTGVFSENRDIIKNEVQGFLGQQRVMAVFVYDGGNHLIYAEKKKSFAGKSSIGREELSAGRPLLLGDDGVTVVERKDAFSFVAPVVLDMTPSAEETFYLDRPTQASQAVIGYVEVLLDSSVLRKEMRAVILSNGLVAAVFLISGGIVIYLVIRRVMEPLTRLTGSVRALGRGDTVDKVPVESRDEIGRLAEDFNAMFDNLQKRDEEKRQLEERLRHAQKMEAVGTLARGIAHDFNNILATIRGSLFIVQKQMSQEGNLGHYGQKIHDAITKAQALVQGLFAFSKNQTVNLQPVDLNALVRKARALIASIIGDNVALQFEPCKGELPVKADLFQMEQVLLNLSSNARDAMPDGGTIIVKTARVRRQQEAEDDGHGLDRHYALLTVADTGAGMDEETRGRIFEPFFTTKEPGQGTGLGLSIVYGIIQQHRGYIEVRSTKGKETVFDIYLPLMETDRERTDGQDAAGAKDTA